MYIYNVYMIFFTKITNKNIFISNSNLFLNSTTNDQYLAYKINVLIVLLVKLI